MYIKICQCVIPADFFCRILSVSCTTDNVCFGRPNLHFKEVHYYEHRQIKNTQNGHARHDGCHRRVISPILRIEGMCPTAHLINIVCSVLLGPWYSLLCATLIGIIRMMFMGIPPLALTGAVFGAFLSGVFYRASHGKIICAVIGEIFGTGIIGSLVSYPVMAFLMGRSGLNAFFYTPMFLAATCMGAPLPTSS